MTLDEPIRNMGFASDYIFRSALREAHVVVIQGHEKFVIKMYLVQFNNLKTCVCMTVLCFS